LINTPLAQLAGLGGVYFLSLLMWLVAVGIAALGFFEWRILPPVLGLLLLGVVYGITRPEVSKPTRSALLVQGNIDPFGRLARPSGKSDLEIFVDLSTPKDKNAVIIYPEAALRLEQLANVGSGLTGLDFSGKPIQVPKFKRLISGVADFRQGDRLNSVAAIQNGRLLGTSTKQHLVPFGEFFIFRRELAFIYNPIFGLLGLGESFGGLNLRYETRTLQLDFERFGTYVCYDSVFPDVSRARVLDGAQVLVNVSNDGWFGRTWGIEQHFLMGRMRAIETGRSVLRVGNTGITAVIDARGQVKQRAPIQQSLALEVRYGLESGQTPYVRFGDWAVGLALLLLGIAVGSSRTNAEAW
jgi:apolipoprotein N-acyltransferase